jgi:hypothetical protein
MNQPGVYTTEYEKRKREMDSPLWESQRKAYLENYFYLWPQIEKIGDDESLTFSSVEDKEMYPDHSVRMTPDLDALFDFITFLIKQQYSYYFIVDPQKWIVCVYKE